jgi:DNA-directed RNA polymerase subunit RPC12/RpoP
MCDRCAGIEKRGYGDDTKTAGTRGMYRCSECGHRIDATKTTQQSLKCPACGHVQERPASAADAYRSHAKLERLSPRRFWNIITESSWDDKWDAEETVKIDFGNGRIVEVPLKISAYRDTPAYYAISIYVDLRPYSPSYKPNRYDMDGPSLMVELASCGRDLSQREVNAGYTVRDMDNSDVWDGCNGDRLMARVVGKTYTLQQLEKLNGGPLPPLQPPLV